MCLAAKNLKLHTQCKRHFIEEAVSIMVCLAVNCLGALLDK